MSRLFKSAFLSLIISLSYSQNKIALNMPHSNVERAILTDKPVDLAFSFRMDGAQIRYTTDGSNPTKLSKRYVRILHISKPGTIKARVFHSDFLTSDIKQIDFRKKGLKIDSITTTPINEKYISNGPKTLIDDTLGNTDFKTNYLGFNTDSTIIDLHFNHFTKIKELGISFCINQAAWIFSPYKIIARNNFGIVVGEKSITNANEPTNEYYRYIEMPIAYKKYDKLHITLKPLSQLPPWHGGAGRLRG